jgi:hypothetical protein
MLYLTEYFSIPEGGDVKRKTNPKMSPFVLVFLTGLLLLGCGKEEKVQPQAPIVEVTEVTQKDVPMYAEWVGTLDGVVNATIRAQVSGYLTKQNYKEGDFVKKGQVLFEIDPREYQAALAQAEQLGQFYVRSSKGDSVPLSALTSWGDGDGHLYCHLHHPGDVLFCGKTGPPQGKGWRRAA